MQVLLLAAAIIAAQPDLSATTVSADDAFADAYTAVSANTLCQKDMFDVRLGLRLYAEASGISNPDTVVMMVNNAALSFEADLIQKHQVPAFCQTMRKFVSKKGKPL